MRYLCAVAAVVCLCCASATSYSYDSRDTNTLAIYAALSGRAAACGVKMDDEMRRVGWWIDGTFGADRGTYLKIFVLGMQDNAKRQSSGATGESCATVREQFAKVVWPVENAPAKKTDQDDPAAKAALKKRLNEEIERLVESARVLGTLK